MSNTDGTEQAAPAAVPDSDGAVRELEKAARAAKTRSRAGEQAETAPQGEVVSLGKSGSGAPEEAAAEVDSAQGKG